MASSDSLRTHLTRLRNAILTGAPGTVTGYNSLPVRQCVEDLADAMIAPAVSAGSVRMAIPMRYSFVPDAVSATAVMAATNLGAEASNVTTGLTNPDVPRNVTIKGNVSGITGNVVVTGTNVNGDTITDTIALNGTTEVAGVKAFKTVTSVALPVCSHTAAQQIETATAVGTITKAGDATVTVTAAALGDSSPLAIDFAVALDDTAADWAAKCRAALSENDEIAAHFEVGGTDDAIILSSKLCLANDSTLNIALADKTSEGITEAPISADTKAGVPWDTVSVGIGAKFGLPHFAKVLISALFGGSADAGTLARDSDELEKNVFALSGAADGVSAVELYYFI